MATRKQATCHVPHPRNDWPAAAHVVEEPQQAAEGAASSCGTALNCGEGNAAEIYAWRLSLRALPITDTDDRLMASAAIRGLSNQPVSG